MWLPVNTTTRTAQPNHITADQVRYIGPRAVDLPIRSSGTRISLDAASFAIDGDASETRSTETRIATETRLGCYLSCKLWLN
nr:hypothetical protein Q903MT_gene1345 [Picea sitchensis]